MIDPWAGMVFSNVAYKESYATEFTLLGLIGGVIQIAIWIGSLKIDGWRYR